MRAVSTPAVDILADTQRQKRDEIQDLLTRAYWMEIESVMNYLASSVNPDGVRAQEIRKALQDDIQQELEHGLHLARRIKELYGVVPGSMGFAPEQVYLQPPDRQTDVVHVIRGVIAAEDAAIELYNRIIGATDEVDWVRRTW